MATFDCISDAYLAMLGRVYTEPAYYHEAITAETVADKTNPVTTNPNWYFNKGSCQELVNISFSIKYPKLTETITTHDPIRNQVIANYADKETALFDVGDITNLHSISKVWDRVKNPDGTNNANYGYMVYHLKDAGNLLYDHNVTSQWDWACNRLKLNKHTNQAYLHFNRPKDQYNGNLDQPCCMYIQFLIRNNELSLYAHMRSNDIIYGMPYNILYFVKLLHRMLAQVKTWYPEVVLGNYHHYAMSLHLYHKHRMLARSMLGL